MSLQLLKFLSTPQVLNIHYEKQRTAKEVYTYNYIVETATSHSKAKMKNYNSKKLVVFHLSQLDLK